jgi:hypothetical protein
MFWGLAQDKERRLNDQTDAAFEADFRRQQRESQR